MARLARSLLAAVFVAALAAPLPARATERPAESFTVVAGGGPHPFTWTWDPAELTIEARSKVTWKNPTEGIHHVTFWRGPSSKSLHLHDRGSAAMKFKKPGVYEYLCDIFGHAQLVDVGPERICVGMCGVITVE